MSRGLEIDFVVYRGDPDEGASAAPSRALLSADADRDGIAWPGAYGAITVHRGDEALLEPRPDPIFKLVSHMVRAVGSLIDGEPETVELSETEHGFLFEPSGEDVMVSFFAGNAFEPDEYLLTEAQMPIEAFSEQVLGLGERLKQLVELTEPGHFERDEYSKSLLEFLELSQESYTSFKRERERGLR